MRPMPFVRIFNSYSSVCGRSVARQPVRVRRMRKTGTMGMMRKKRSK
jgi:hypothetical protein